jgi:hypothetical protein
MLLLKVRIQDRYYDIRIEESELPNAVVIKFRFRYYFRCCSKYRQTIFDIFRILKCAKRKKGLLGLYSYPTGHFYCKKR